MEILLMLATAVGLNLAAIGASTVYFKRLFISEEKFHILTDDGQVRVIQGKRRTPLKVSEAEAHLANVKKAARRSGNQWIISLWNLHGPKNTRKMDTDLDVVRRHAVESQRTSLLVEAMNKGYDETAVMATIMKAFTDEHFEKLRKALKSKQQSEALTLAASIEAEIRKNDGSNRKEIVLMELGKKATSKAIVANPDKSGGVPLPEGYSWDIGWTDRGRSYEKMVVLLRRANGRIIRSDEFYTSVWNTPAEQRQQILDIQRKLAYAARHDMDPSGISPEIRALL